MTERRGIPGWLKGVLFVLALAVLVAAVVVIIKYAPRPPREMLDADAGTPLRIEVHELRSGNDAVIDDPETAETVAAAFRGHTFRRNGGTYGMQGYTLHFFFEDGSENVIEMQWETSLKLGHYSYIPADGADYSAVWSLLTGLFAAEDREVESVTVRKIGENVDINATTDVPEQIDAIRTLLTEIVESGNTEAAASSEPMCFIRLHYSDGTGSEYTVHGGEMVIDGEAYPLNAEQQRALGEAVDAVLAALDAPTPEETVRTYYLAQEDDGWERYDSLLWPTRRAERHENDAPNYALLGVTVHDVREYRGEKRWMLAKQFLETYPDELGGLSPENVAIVLARADLSFDYSLVGYQTDQEECFFLVRADSASPWLIYDHGAGYLSYAMEFGGEHQLTAADASYWDACDKHMFTAPDTAVRTEPRDDAPVGRTLSGWTVRVCAVVWADDTEPWALVTCFTFDSAVNNIGWVRWSSLIEYTAETREALRYPVGVAEGARDSATGELIWPADGDFAVEYRDGVAYLTREGGDAWTVKPEDVVYPEV